MLDILGLQISLIISLIFVFLLCIRLLQAFMTYPEGKLTINHIRFSELHIATFPTESRILDLWYRFYAMRDVYKEKDFIIAMRFKFDYLFESTLKIFTDYTNRKEILLIIFNVLREMPNISANPSYICYIAKQYTLLEEDYDNTIIIFEIIKHIRYSQKENDFLQTWTQKTENLLFYGSIIVLTIIAVMLFPVFYKFRVFKSMHYFEPYRLLGQAVPIIHMAIAISPIVDNKIYQSIAKNILFIKLISMMYFMVFDYYMLSKMISMKIHFKPENLVTVVIKSFLYLHFIGFIHYIWTMQYLNLFTQRTVNRQSAINFSIATGLFILALIFDKASELLIKPN